MASIAHAAARKAFSTALKAVLKQSKKKRGEGYVNIINVIEKLNGDTWPAESYDRLRETFGSNGKWAQFFDELLDTVDV